MNCRAPSLNLHPRLSASRTKRALAALLLLSSPALFAGTNLWTRGSGLSANVSSISVNPQNPAVLYATAGNAIYKSNNGGNDWSAGTTLNGGYTYNLVTTHPQSPDYVFVGMAAWGIGRSINGGSDWRLQNGSAPYAAGSGFTCPLPTYPARVYNFDGTVDDDQISDTGPDTIAGNADDDSTLAPRYCTTTTPTAPGYAECHATPAAGDYVLYGPRPTIGGFEVFATIASYCTNPTPAHSGTSGTPPRDPYPPGGVTAMAFSRTNGSIGFAAFQGRGVYLTDNATRTVFCPTVDPNPNNDPDSDLPGSCSAYGVGEPDYWPGGYRVNWGTGGGSLAGGADSGATIPGGTSINSLVIREAGPQVYAGSNGQGIYLRSNAFNAAGTWSKTSCGSGGDTGNAVCNIQALALSPSEQYLWAATLNNGVWRADVSAGTTTAWSKVSNVASSHACFAALQNVRSLAFASWFDQASASNKTRVYVGSFGQGVCYTDDDGSTWAALNAGLTDSASGSLLGLYVTSLAVDPLNPIRVYAGTYAGVYAIQIVPGSSTGGLSASGSAYSGGTLSFGTQAVGQSATQVVSLTNRGLVTINITGVTDTSGDFSSTNTCGASLTPGASCQLFITFAPTVAAAYNASLTVSSDAIEGPLTINLSGTGQGSSGGGSLTASPTSLDFGSIATGSSNSKTVTLTAGSQSVTLAEISVPSGFELIDQCGSLLPASASCTLTVTFKPSTAVSQRGNLIIQSNASGSPHSVALTGVGVQSSASGGSLSVTPASLAFGNVAIGASSTKTITLAATGQSVSLTEVTVPTGFTLTNSCGTLIPAGGLCTLIVSFVPDIAIAYAGSVLIQSNASSNLQAVALSGQGSVQGGPILGLDVFTHDFGAVAINSSTSKAFVLKNVGTAAFVLDLSSALEGSGYSLAPGGCYSFPPPSVAPGSSCTLTVVFNPTDAGSYSGTITFSGEGTYNARISLKGSAASVVSGTGQLGITQTSIDFGSTPPGTTLSRQLMLSATGSGVSLSGFTLPDAYNYSTSCGAEIPVNTSCSLQLNFSPTRAGQFIGSLLIQSNAAGAPLVVSLSGSSADTTTFSGTTTGTPDALSLTGHFRFSSWDARGGGYFYVVGLAGDQLWFFDGHQWRPYAGETRPPFVKAGPFTAFDSLIFNGINTALLPGAAVFLAYGSNIDDAVRNQKYRLIYTFP